MTFEPPRETKDSGVRWLGRIPAHWAVVPSRRLFAERNERPKVGDEQLTVSQRHGLLSQADFMQREGRRIVQVLKGHDILKHTEAGDFVMSMRSFQGGLEYSSLTGSVSSAYVPLKPIKWVEPGFFRHLFKSSAYIHELQGTSDLVRDGQALRFENFSKVALPVVPLHEQADIAEYLDRATARVDTLIATKTRFIELLREKRLALITHAVTKGLKADVPMKHGGADWLGDVPRHWTVTRVSFLATKVGSGKTPEGGASTYVKSGVMFLRSQNVHDDGLRLDDVVYISEATHDTMRSSRILPGDVLLNITGASIGRSSIAPTSLKEANVNQHVCIVRLADDEMAAWVHWVFCSQIVKGQVEFLQTGAGREGLNFEQVGDLQLAIPPVDERVAIVAYLGRTTTRVDSLLATTEHSIELLREHRTALVTAAVTGKVDLRGVAQRTA